MEKSEFEELYKKYKTRDLAIMLGVSIPTIYKRIKQLNIKKKGKGKGSRCTRKLKIEIDV